MPENLQKKKIIRYISIAKKKKTFSQDRIPLHFFESLMELAVGRFFPGDLGHVG